MTMDTSRITRILFAPFLLLILVTYLIRRGYSAVAGRFRQEVNHRAVKAGETIVSVYDTSVPVIEDLGPANAWRRMWEAVPRQSRVLDIGCSTGYLGLWLAQTRGCIVEGVDIFDADLDIARTRLHAVYRVDLEQKGWEQSVNGPYDVILMMDVVEHVRNADSLLRAARKLLAPGGMLIVNVPNVANWRLRFELLRGRWNYQSTGLMDRTHVYFYTMETLAILLKDAGFMVDVILPTVPGRDLMGVHIGTSLLGHKLLLALLKMFPNLLSYQIMAQSHVSGVESQSCETNDQPIPQPATVQKIGVSV